MSDPPPDRCRAHRDGSRRPAEAIAAIVLDLGPPRSVIDVGGALGAWRAVFHEQGATASRDDQLR